MKQSSLSLHHVKHRISLAINLPVTEHQRVQYDWHQVMQPLLQELMLQPIVQKMNKGFIETINNDKHFYIRCNC